MKPDFQKIPPVQEIDQYLKNQGQHHGKEVRLQVKACLTEIRENTRLLQDVNVTRNDILELIANQLATEKNELLPIINGTGAIIHTNLGRSVFSKEILDAVINIGMSYTNLEFSLKTGKRGARLSNVGSLLKTLTGAEEVVVVNNNAAAVLLTLTAFAKDREVIVSRGELIEIGGSFRIPEVITVSGARLKEVGATNRTRISDYQNAINDQSAVLFKAHTSNYEIVGFTENTSTGELAALAKKENLILVEDIGSGALIPFFHSQLNSEPLIPNVLKEGADVVTISGDKLVGGPQSGIILGRKKYLDILKKHPLYRALRCDKMTMLLLEKTLLAYIQNRQQEVVPTQRMLNETSDQVKARAESILENRNDTLLSLGQCKSTPGGGSLPGKKIDSWCIELNKADWNENKILDFLRDQNPPVIGRIFNGKPIIDCRTVLPDQIKNLQNVLDKFINA